jgi:hypothetical protein
MEPPQIWAGNAWPRSPEIKLKDHRHAGTKDLLSPTNRLGFRGPTADAAVDLPWGSMIAFVPRLTGVELPVSRTVATAKAFPSDSTERPICKNRPLSNGGLWHQSSSAAASRTGICRIRLPVAW